MGEDEAIVVKSFLNRSEADVAAARLRGHGIECLMEADDAGGMYPTLHPVKLLVPASQVEAARRVLNEPPPELPRSAGSGAAVGERPEPPTAPTPPLLKFGLGLGIGLVLGLVTHITYLEYRQRGEQVYRYDADGDGHPDEEHVWRNGEIVRSRYDRDGDTQFDMWSRYKNGVLVATESDEDFDGRADSWVGMNARGFAARSTWDTDFNGIPDATTIFQNDVPVQTDWSPNGTNVVLLRQLYQRGVMREELWDMNAEGTFDFQVRYDSFSRPIATNVLGAKTSGN